MRLEVQAEVHRGNPREAEAASEVRESFALGSEDSYLHPGPGKPGLEFLLSTYRSNWNIENAGRKTYYRLELEILERYYEFDIRNWQRALWTEEPFSVPVGRHLLLGKFDRVDYLGHGAYSITDYKAEIKCPSYAKVDRDLQLSLYALAFWKLKGLVPALIVLYHLTDNRPLPTVRAQDDI